MIFSISSSINLPTYIRFFQFSYVFITISFVIAVDVPGPCLCIRKKIKDLVCDPVLHRGIIRDDICHDMANNKECHYDGGDCCRPGTYKGTPYCVECR